MAGSAARIYAGLAPTTTTMMVAATATTLFSPRLRPPPRPSPSSSIYHLHRGRGCCGARNADLRCRRRLLTARGERPPPDDDDEEEEEDPSSSATAAGFDAAVALFNRGEYHACHDVVEELWYGAEDPARTLLHGLLQCAVGFHHLFNQNHRGAMMELGEGLCKLRKLNLHDDDPFSRFREEAADVLQFLYRTQKELAACTCRLYYHVIVPHLIPSLVSSKCC
ncbi:hypothetical protein PVAP13_8KG009500 [Panicum virgatum]|uniref:DUF309 domain-containing protein n=1 Tax=Panicum virgatum TaxID=38727 RepID=A0A8T0PNK6_PANVG|nr:hypothetical protein PVAP13_8KG009500 [Panicum virgatum]